MALFRRNTAVQTPEVGPVSRPVKAQKSLKFRIQDSISRNLFGLAQALGTAFGGNRNYYNVFGYPMSLTYQNNLQRYRREGIAKRSVDAPADAIWTNPPDYSPSPSNLVTTLDDLVKRLDLWSVLNRADKLAGIGQYSTILMGFDRGGDFSTPAPKGAKIIYLQPYGQGNMDVSAFENEPTNPRYGKPVTYSLKGTNTTDGSSMIFGTQRPKLVRSQQYIHWTRVIHIVENGLEDDVYGSPRIEAFYNILDDILKIGGGGAEIYWLNARGGLHIDVDKEMAMDTDDEDNLADEVEDYVNQLTRVIRTRGIKATPLKHDTPDPRNAFEVAITLLSATTKIPQRILMGAEAGQLASEQDRANWSTSVEERRASFAVSVVIRQVILKLVDLGMVTIEDALQAALIWPDAFKLNPLERAQTAAQQARSAANLVKVFDNHPDFISYDEGRKIVSNTPSQLQGGTAQGTKAPKPQPQTPAKGKNQPPPNNGGNA